MSDKAEPLECLADYLDAQDAMLRSFYPLFPSANDASTGTAEDLKPLALIAEIQGRVFKQFKFTKEMKILAAHVLEQGIYFTRSYEAAVAREN